ncbi:MAG: hypothetical protein HKL80_05810 [Acidimicrobiales bacterium]|nr:hypothetical protein [Acidimicrobiales bacterium]
MEDIVAVRVLLDTNDARYFLTWGRIYDPVDCNQTAEVVMAFAKTCSLGGRPITSEICYSLHKASNEEYFYESLFDMAISRGPKFGFNYEEWVEAKRVNMESGLDIWYLGKPRRK